MGTNDRDWQVPDHPPEPDEPVDPLPGMLHDLEQGLAQVHLWAKVVRGQYEALLNEGFTPMQALYFLAAMRRSEDIPEEA